MRIGVRTRQRWGDCASANSVVGSALPIGTITYYLRQGLLSPGSPSSPNQATYGPHHEQRLRFVRALSGRGGSRSPGYAS
ncbi:MerR family transcriptional regulator [Streptomyces xantholiticus]